MKQVHVIPVWNGMNPMDAYHEQEVMGRVHGYRWWWPLLAKLHLKKLEWAVIEDDDA